MSRLMDYADKGMLEQSSRLDDIAGQEVTIAAIRFATAQFGEIAFIDVQTGDGSKTTVMTGAMFVLPALHKALEAAALPVQAVFSKKGRTWIFE